MSVRHVKLLIWNLVLSLAVMSFMAQLYCRNRWHIYLWEYVRFMWYFWWGWFLAGLLVLAVHSFVDQIVAEYRINVMGDKVTKAASVGVFLRRATVYLCWEPRLSDSTAKAFSVPVQLVLLVTGLVIGTTYPYDFCYPLHYHKYSNVPATRRIEQKVREHFKITLNPGWLYELHNVSYDVRRNQEKFDAWLLQSNIIREYERSINDEGGRNKRGSNNS